MNCYRITALLLLVTLVGPVSADPLTPDELKFFESKIRPVLIKECYGCHSNKSGNVRGGLRLDTKELTHIGGSSGAAIVPGDLEESLLYNAITHEDFVMPPKRKGWRSEGLSHERVKAKACPSLPMSEVAEINSPETSRW